MSTKAVLVLSAYTFCFQVISFDNCTTVIPNTYYPVEETFWQTLMSFEKELEIRSDRVSLNSQVFKTLEYVCIISVKQHKHHPLTGYLMLSFGYKTQYLLNSCQMATPQARGLAIIYQSVKSNRLILLSFTIILAASK